MAAVGLSSDPQGSTGLLTVAVPTAGHQQQGLSFVAAQAAGLSGDAGAQGLLILEDGQRLHRSGSRGGSLSGEASGTGHTAGGGLDQGAEAHGRLSVDWISVARKGEPQPRGSHGAQKSQA